MVRILQSSWTSMLVGGLLFMATTAVLMKPLELPNMEVSAKELIHVASNEPSWKFRNPELDQWIQEIKTEKESLALREQQLKDLETRLNAERQELSVVTQAVHQMQADFDKNVVRLNAQDGDNLKREVKLLSSMSPEGELATLSEMTDDHIVRILLSMKTEQAGQILESFGKGGKDQAKRSLTLMEMMRHSIPASSAEASTK